MESKRIFVLVFLAAMLIFASQAISGGRFGGGEMGGGPGMHGMKPDMKPCGMGPGGPFMGLHLLAELDLTDDQKTKTKEILQTAKTDAETYRSEMISFKDSLFDTASAETYVEEDIRSITASMAEVEEELEVIRAKAIFNIRSILTEEQLNVLDEEIEEMKSRREECMEEAESMMEDHFDSFFDTEATSEEADDESSSNDKEA